MQKSDDQLFDRESDSEAGSSDEDCDPLTKKCQQLFATRVAKHNKIKTEWMRRTCDVTNDGKDVKSNSISTSLDNLRQKIISLMDDDDELFRRLLRLNRVITTLKRDMFEDDFESASDEFYYREENGLEQSYCIPEDLEDNGSSSAASTWRSSSSSQNEAPVIKKPRSRTRRLNYASSYGDLSIESDSSRLEPTPDRYFTKVHINSELTPGHKHHSTEQVNSYDSGIHEQSSDSEHEIFV